MKKKQLMPDSVSKLLWFVGDWVKYCTIYRTISKSCTTMRLHRLKLRKYLLEETAGGRGVRYALPDWRTDNLNLLLSLCQRGCVWLVF